MASEVLAFEMTADERKTVIKLPDAIIAATALHRETPLFTRNIKDFKKVKGLKVVTT
ncbi:MAG: hypothetical protein AAB383_06590 [Patescibacteria group bacterium]